ncbi:MAG: hypothetical protein KBD46_00830 [Candidatus Levybacteria bacterium]|nr:hypothetical protein [Candidatus Levybacteria bacterium]
MSEHAPLHYVPSQEAVADAVLMSQAHLLLKSTVDYSSYDSETALEKATNDKCAKAAVYSLYYLYKNYSYLFPKMAILGTNSVNFSRYPESSPLRNDWEHHKYFLVQDTSGMWFTASPGNYSKENPEYTKPFASKNLSKIMHHIESRDGGVWPSAKFLDMSLSQNYNAPTIDSNLDTITFHFTLLEKMHDDENVVPLVTTFKTMD